jgi:thiamine kinase-like enzyme
MSQQIYSMIEAIPAWQSSVITPLHGGLTNQNYRIDVDGESFVMRICGKNTEFLGIDRRHERACATIAAHVGVGPEVIPFTQFSNVLCTRFVRGITLSAEAACRPSVLRRIVKSIRQYHNGPAFPSLFSPFATVRNYYALALQHKVSLPTTLPQIFNLMEQIETALADVTTLCPCHNDLLASNFIDDGEKIWVLDWEYAAMGDLFFDLGNFAVNQGLDSVQCQLLLQYYFGTIRSADLAHLHLMRLASDLREGFWGLLQSGISSLDFDYQEYANKHLNRFLTNATHSQFAEWLVAVRNKAC